jgi:hypothetical protein
MSNPCQNASGERGVSNGRVEMKRWIAVALVGVALALAGTATAAPASQHAWGIGLFALGGGSAATTGHVRDAPQYGGITSGPLCCEISVEFVRNFNADVMHGSVSGTFVVGGNPDGTVWHGKLRGTMTPEGSNGVLIASEDGTGRRFVGTWTIVGHADQSIPHFISLAVEGDLHGG